MKSLTQILDEQDERDLHGQAPAVACVNHLGTSSCTVGELFAALRDRSRPAIRSGHVGNWEEIWQGQVGLVDYNRYICRDLELGVPVIHAHTFTETADLTDGDTIYLPAGRIRQRSYERLEVFVKQGEELVPVPPDDSVCCAFAFIETEHGPEPLVRARAVELAAAPGATTIPTLLGRDEDLLRRVLTRLVDDALDTEGGLDLDQVFGSSVSRQGRRGAAPRSLGAGGFDVDGTVYASRSALVDGALESLRYGSLAEHGAHEGPQPVDEYLPLLGATTVLALVAYLDCHRAGGDSVHTHWGAISMSGYPPLAGGYFGRRATRRTLRWMGESLARLPELSFDLRFALLPAPVLSLLPPRELALDCDLVGDLVAGVLEKTDRPGADPSGALAQITDLTRSWLADNRDRLSPYYLNRFGLSRTVFNGTAQVPTDGTPLDASLLSELTMQQASMLLGSLLEEAKRMPEEAPA